MKTGMHGNTGKLISEDRKKQHEEEPCYIIFIKKTLLQKYKNTVRSSLARGGMECIGESIAASSSIALSSSHAFFPLYSQSITSHYITAFAASLQTCRKVIINADYFVFSSVFFFLKNPPARHTSTATPATMADPTMPETVVPAGLSPSEANA